MYEYKTERVAPAQQDETTNRNAAFGWELMSAQETYHENTKLSEVTDSEIKTKTEVTNYVTLQFRRDTSIPHYKELVELENKVILLSPEKPAIPIYPIIRTIIAVLCTMALIGQIMMEGIEDLIGISMWIYAACYLLLIIGWVTYAVKNSKYKIAKRQYDKKMEQCAEYCAQARNLTYGK